MDTHHVSDDDFRKTLLGVCMLVIMVSFILSIPFFDLITRKPVNSPFVSELKVTEEGSDKALIFFGFVGCVDTCPTTMAVLRQLMQLDPNTVNYPQVVFIDIDRKSNITQANMYAKQFDERFIAYFPENKELARLKMEFGLNVRQNGSKIDHVGRVYLLELSNKTWWLTKAYSPNNFAVKDLLSDLGV